MNGESENQVVPTTKQSLPRGCAIVLIVGAFSMLGYFILRLLYNLVSLPVAMESSDGPVRIPLHVP